MACPCLFRFCKREMAQGTVVCASWTCRGTERVVEDGEAEVSWREKVREVRVDPHRKSSEVRTGYFRPRLGKGGQQQPPPKSVVTTREHQHICTRDGKLGASACGRYLL